MEYFTSSPIRCIHLQKQCINPIWHQDVRTWIPPFFLIPPLLKGHRITCFCKENSDTQLRASSKWLSLSRRGTRAASFDARYTVIRHTNLCAQCKQKYANCSCGSQCMTSVTPSGSAKTTTGWWRFKDNHFLSSLFIFLFSTLLFIARFNEKDWNIQRGRKREEYALTLF